MLPPELRATFEGYPRPNGKTGTRNYIGVLTSVNCSATVAKFIAEEVNRSGVLDDYPGIDGVMPLVHGTGCGMAAKGEGFDVLRRTQWGYATHPNMGAALHGRARLRGVPDRPHEGASTASSKATFSRP